MKTIIIQQNEEEEEEEQQQQQQQQQPPKTNDCFPARQFILWLAEDLRHVKITNQKVKG